jgi:ABC-type uncharacterized transport system ATPase subunit
MPRQTRIPGTEGKKIKEIDKAAEKYVELRDARIAAGVKEKEAKAELLAAMKANKLKIYQDDDAVPPLLVTITPSDFKLKVAKVTGEDEEDGDEGEEETEETGS